ncbi:RYR3 protein, partial [Rhinoptilus africanus]|nr:RYR3 protein [Rhinoptilus africanus]
TLKELISQTMVRWSQEDEIQDPELVRVMYTLLRRQYDSIGELLQALRKAYTISAASVKDTINLLAALGQIRSLLSVRMGKEEELLMINGLGSHCRLMLSFSSTNSPKSLSSGLLSICFPPILCLCLGLPQIMCRTLHLTWLDFMRFSPLYVPYCPLQNVFQHFKPNDLMNTKVKRISFPSMRGSTPLDVAAASVMDNNELALALEEPDLDKVVTYLAGCGLQSCPVLLAKGYPDIGWNPIEGERYLSFLRFAVFVN